MVEMGTVVGIVTAYLGATEATKRWFFRSEAQRLPDQSGRFREPCPLAR
jgi:hypothetical protein